MNWLTNFVRPKIRGLVKQRDLPDNLWEKCPACSQMAFHRELDANLRVCPHCGHHLRLSAKQRMDMLFDDEAYKRIELPETPVDPLKFKDRRKYADRLKETQAKLNEKDAIQVAHGTIGGVPAVVAAFDFQFMGGSMGIAVGEGIVAAARLAVVQDAALIIVPSSGGARMQEGILSLMQMARTTVAIDEVREARLPYIAVLADPTTGGVSASFAMLGDIAIAEPGAIIGFAGARVIEQTIREKLPEGFQRAEYLLEHGMIDMVVKRKDLRNTLARVLDLLRNRGPAGELVPLPPLGLERKREFTVEEASAE
ncbi:MAG: acetyl-CoA carboxylase, carboxyltransferase subunit beta [Rhodospirillales bacterium]|nr:acetyl-CoA carboxylase, carboxyltransferase subunit beta [Rhodospirillales bacterium]MCW8860892.1 acetyl-CoA carboxylase, carboxyltransferase subunit beta [Rhodospirillales bacterium]MCW8952174.1 acetyl-CoA carboxylase, carboxyltransferase subunit beta [Rhodospirillales bacterium]MCW8970712.1 acetyl-CoA carboxylase, carboxyltransferase subunit beta [Rhodospirillales bacterium]MCW9001171.1 acetyl-CoA carboxylase, carboxyltransferase subunit beta [Rhodospirillales bacterium]